jgi:TrmH family RNA methyltransferase
MLVGEGIRDPRNVGVLIRTADAVGAAAAAFTEDSADPYCRASVRSSTGSILSLPVALSDDLPSFLVGLRDTGVRVVGTSAHADLTCGEADLSLPCAVVVGTESTGLSDAAAEACDLLVSIPMHGSADSYNVTVAAGIVLYEVMRQVGR